MSAEGFPRHLRALLTETLPFELPLVFTNEFRYNALVAPPSDAQQKRAWADLRAIPTARSQPYTVPYHYVIRKERAGTTTLSLMHPESQVSVAQFYADYAETLIATCSLSKASLRYPATVARIYTANELDNKATQKTGQVHVEPEQELEQKDVSRAISFFTYRDINLLSKFFDSPAYLALEKRFSKLRTLDVSRCFYNIYTHSVTWAVKSKRFAKENANAHSFEQKFDKLMQKMNYNETNGIVVGPEISRIFAEVIFQRIDTELFAKLAEGPGPLRQGVDYDLRRYVDDYFLYANDVTILDRVQRELETILEEYKLYLNESKINNLERPFVTPLSTARRQVRRAMFDLKASVDDVRNSQDPRDFRRLSQVVKGKTLETRLIIGEHGVGFHNISSWCLSLLQSMIAELFNGASKITDNDEQRLNCFERSLWALFSLVFYIVSLDIRVPTTYALGNLLTVRESEGYRRLLEHSDWIDHVIESELIELATHSHNAFYVKAGCRDAVETLNILIMGSHMFGPSFVNNAEITGIIDDLMKGPPSYFIYISLKFVFLKDKASHASRLEALNAAANQVVVDHRRDLSTFSEKYLLFCDLLSAPDLSADQKRELWKAVLRWEPSNATFGSLAAICGFVDWGGLRLTHSLRRRRLRPVYE
jgi:hypothetical protein